MPGAIDKGQLIWTGSVVNNVLDSFLCLLDVSDDGVAETESFMELLQLEIILMISILDVIFEFRVLKVDISYTRWVLKWLRIIFAILEGTCRESFELHDILCQSTCLIAKDIVYHTQLFIEV